jgi:phospholipase C
MSALTRRFLLRASAVAAGLVVVVAGTVTPAVASLPAVTPIQHVVIIYQENHSFDEVLGALCVQDARCDGSLTAKLSTGGTRQLTRSPDVVPTVNHDTASQTTAIDGGRMDGFNKISGCTSSAGYKCLTYYDPTQIPNLAALARKFTISDRTFQMDKVPSFGAHLELVAQVDDGFTGVAPKPKTGFPAQVGWGCDSNRFAQWRASPGAAIQLVPSCVPDYTDPLPRLTSDRSAANGGAITTTPVQHVDTLMDRLDDAGVSWKLYTSPRTSPVRAWTWAICPVFADCIYTSQADDLADPTQAITDGKNGTLPNFSVVLPEGPTGGTSQHNGSSMASGDNWIGSVVSAIENGPDWASTAIFITYDDCGCFYDHVAPPAGLGIRNPVVIVSPYAKPRFTDSTVATTSSLLAFVEHTFSVPALSSADANAYDYANAFDFSQTPLSGSRMTQTAISPAEQAYLAAHPADPDDPT